MTDDLSDVHELLTRWASFARGGMPGNGTTAEGYLRERLDKAHDGEWPEDVVNVERAVLKLYQDRPEYRLFFNAYYLTPPAGLSIYEIGHTYGHSQKNVARVIESAQRFINWVLTTG